MKLNNNLISYLFILPLYTFARNLHEPDSYRLRLLISPLKVTPTVHIKRVDFDYASENELQKILMENLNSAIFTVVTKKI